MILVQKSDRAIDKYWLIKSPFGGPMFERSQVPQRLLKLVGPGQ